MLQTLATLQHQIAEFERNASAREQTLKERERRVIHREEQVDVKEQSIEPAAAKLASDRLAFDEHCKQVTADLDRREAKILRAWEDLVSELRRPPAKSE
jgi:predicted  nucleic acid-binding Zn-ribbon protein